MRQSEVVAPAAGRFNERLVLSLASCPTCILMDDELNILPTSSHVARIAPLPLADDGTPAVPTASASSAAELKELVASLADTQVQNCLFLTLTLTFHPSLPSWRCWSPRWPARRCKCGHP